MKILKGILIALLILAIVGGLGLSNFIGNSVFEGSTRLVTNEDTSMSAHEFGAVTGQSYDFVNENYIVEKQGLESSAEGHTIPLDYIYAKDGDGKENNKTVVLVHGLGGNRNSNYPVALFFLNEGYNVITYDQRNTNENLADRSTFGYLEKNDLLDIINYVKRFAPNSELGLWGTSFGGATVGLALGYENTQELIDFAILDCPVSSMEWMINRQMQDIDMMEIPLEYATFTGNIVNRIKLGFSYEDADVVTAISRVKTPLLVINTEVDEVTPQFMGDDIYSASAAETKEIWTVPDSSHANIMFDYPEEYVQRVLSFIEKTK